MANISSLTDNFFATPQEGFVTQLGSTISSGATTVPLNSVAGYTDGEPVVLVIEPDNDLKKAVFIGTIDTSGIQVENVLWTEGNVNEDHTAGVVVADYVTATHMAALVKGLISAVFDQDGTLKASAVDNVNVLANDVVETAKIKDLNVTTAKLATASVTGIKQGIPIVGRSSRSTQSIGNGSTASISFDTEDIDTDTMIDIAGNPTRLTIKTAGIYTIVANGEWASNSTGRRDFAIRLNGSTILAGNDDVAGGNVTLLKSCSITRAFAANDYIEVRVQQTSGSSLAIGNLGLSGIYHGPAS